MERHGVLHSYLNYVYVENPKEKSLTSMKVYVGQTVTGMTVRCKGPLEDT